MIDYLVIAGALILVFGGLTAIGLINEHLEDRAWKRARACYNRNHAQEDPLCQPPSSPAPGPQNL